MFGVFIKVFKHSLMITSFVFVMMLLIEYINAQTKGTWQNSFKNRKWLQYILGSLLGAIPGCLGAFSVVTLYTHRIVGLGVLVAAMIATSGDETFVMFAMFPGKALLLTGVIFFIGIIAGYVTDLVYKKQHVLLKNKDYKLPDHGNNDTCYCFRPNQIVYQLKNISFVRVLLMVVFSLLIIFMIGGSIGPAQWDWIKITFMASFIFALFVVSTVPDHFLEEHIWEHLFKKHLVSIFLWIFGTILLIHFLEGFVNLNDWVKQNNYYVLLIAVLIGIIPESGPHMIFVTLYANGTIPFSILLASSIVQDGHGMLPLLASSKRSFVSVKLINMAVGLAVGFIGLVLIK